MIPPDTARSRDSPRRMDRGEREGISAFEREVYMELDQRYKRQKLIENECRRLHGRQKKMEAIIQDHVNDTMDGLGESKHLIGEMQVVITRIGDKANKNEESGAALYQDVQAQFEKDAKWRTKCEKFIKLTKEDAAGTKKRVEDTRHEVASYLKKFNDRLKSMEAGMKERDEKIEALEKAMAKKDEDFAELAAKASKRRDSDEDEGKAAASEAMQAQLDDMMAKFEENNKRVEQKLQEETTKRRAAQQEARSHALKLRDVIKKMQEDSNFMAVQAFKDGAAGGGSKTKRLLKAAAAKAIAQRDSEGADGSGEEEDMSFPAPGDSSRPTSSYSGARSRPASAKSRAGNGGGGGVMGGAAIAAIADLGDRLEAMEARVSEQADKLKEARSKLDETSKTVGATESKLAKAEKKLKDHAEKLEEASEELHAHAKDISKVKAATKRDRTGSDRELNRDRDRRDRDRDRDDDRDRRGRDRSLAGGDVDERVEKVEEGLKSATDKIAQMAEADVTRDMRMTTLEQEFKRWAANLRVGASAVARRKSVQAAAPGTPKAGGAADPGASTVAALLAATPAPKLGQQAKKGSDDDSDDDDDDEDGESKADAPGAHIKGVARSRRASVASAAGARRASKTIDKAVRRASLVSAGGVTPKARRKSLVADVRYGDEPGHTTDMVAVTQVAATAAAVAVQDAQDKLKAQELVTSELMEQLATVKNRLLTLETIEKERDDVAKQNSKWAKGDMEGELAGHSYVAQGSEGSNYLMAGRALQKVERLEEVLRAEVAVRTRDAKQLREAVLKSTRAAHVAIQDANDKMDAQVRRMREHVDATSDRLSDEIRGYAEAATAAVEGQEEGLLAISVRLDAQRSQLDQRVSELERVTTNSRTTMVTLPTLESMRAHLMAEIDKKAPKSMVLEAQQAAAAHTASAGSLVGVSDVQIALESSGAAARSAAPRAGSVAGSPTRAADGTDAAMAPLVDENAKRYIVGLGALQEELGKVQTSLKTLEADTKAQLTTVRETMDRDRANTAEATRVSADTLAQMQRAEWELSLKDLKEEMVAAMRSGIEGEATERGRAIAKAKAEAATNAAEAVAASEKAGKASLELLHGQVMDAVKAQRDVVGNLQEQLERQATSLKAAAKVGSNAEAEAARAHQRFVEASSHLETRIGETKTELRADVQAEATKREEADKAARTKVEADFAALKKEVREMVLNESASVSAMAKSIVVAEGATRTSDLAAVKTSLAGMLADNKKDVEMSFKAALAQEGTERVRESGELKANILSDISAKIASAVSSSEHALKALVTAEQGKRETAVEQLKAAMSSGKDENSKERAAAIDAAVSKAMAAEVAARDKAVSEKAAELHAAIGKAREASSAELASEIERVRVGAKELSGELSKAREASSAELAAAVSKLNEALAAEVEARTKALEAEAEERKAVDTRAGLKTLADMMDETFSKSEEDQAKLIDDISKDMDALGEELEALKKQTGIDRAAQGEQIAGIRAEVHALARSRGGSAAASTPAAAVAPAPAPAAAEPAPAPAPEPAAAPTGDAEAAPTGDAEAAQPAAAEAKE